MSCSSIDAMFPAKTVGSIETPSAIILNGMPSIITLTIITMFNILKQPFKPLIKRKILVLLSFVSIVIITFLLWRVFDVLECKNRLELIPYKYLVLVVFPLVSSAVFLSLYFRNTYRLSSLLFALLGSGFVAVDFSLRKFSDKDAAQPIFAAQTFACCLALSSLLGGRYFPLQVCGTKNNIATTNENFSHSRKEAGEGYCYQPNFIDPTSRHPVEAKGVGSAPELRSVFN